jgi:hypothetical protein
MLATGHFFWSKQVKRIIDGITYNTATSTRLATSEYETEYNHQDRRCEGALFQTLGGAFFVWETIHLGVDGDGGNVTRDRFKALSAKEAEDWIMSGDVEIIHNPFGEPPEAEAESSPASTLYVRVPSALKRQVEDAAKDDNLSVNAYMLKCAENCLKKDRLGEPLGKIWEISSTFRAARGDGKWTRDTLMEALNEIAGETENLVEEMFPGESESVLANITAADETYVQDIRKKYNPYPIKPLSERRL